MGLRTSARRALVEGDAIMENWEKEFRLRLGEQLASAMFWELLPVFLAGCACGAFAIGVAVIATILVM